VFGLAVWVFLTFKHQKAKSHFKKPGILAFGKQLFKTYQKVVSKSSVTQTLFLTYWLFKKPISQ